AQGGYGQDTQARGGYGQDAQAQAGYGLGGQAQGGYGQGGQPQSGYGLDGQAEGGYGAGGQTQGGYGTGAAQGGFGLGGQALGGQVPGGYGQDAQGLGGYGPGGLGPDVHGTGAHGTGGQAQAGYGLASYGTDDYGPGEGAGQPPEPVTDPDRRPRRRRSGPAEEPAALPERASARGFLPGSDIGAEPADDGRSQGAAGGNARRDSGRGGGRPPKKRRRRSGWLAGLVAGLVILGGLGVAGTYGFRILEAKYHPANFQGAGQGDVVVHVSPGDIAESVAPQLLKLGVVASTRAFVQAAKAAPPTPGLQPGFFKLHKHMNAALAWKLLVSPSARIQKSVTLPEGLRESQIVARLGVGTALPASAYQAAVKNAAALGLPSFADGKAEGYLFPDTYEIQPGMNATQVLKLMVNRFKKEARDIGLPAAAKAGNLSESHTIIIASLIQAEGGQLSDFPKIAEVIYNRLRNGMKLQLDSTVEYALGKYGIRATDQELQNPSPYNTYAHTGLPPGPIDSPGDAAIKAALHPDHGNLIYFVTVDPRQHITKFTSSHAEFIQFQKELNRNLARGG
ncbi:MAG: endolytic transglycosylase MltG, partial [Actinomycetota bacterium]